jgi:hypothetical protein
VVVRVVVVRVVAARVVAARVVVVRVVVVRVVVVKGVVGSLHTCNRSKGHTPQTQVSGGLASVHWAVHIS